MKEIILKAIPRIKERKFWLTLGIDLLFGISIIILAIVSTSMINVSKGITAAILSIVHLLAVVLIYSLFKYLVLKAIIGKVKKNKLQFFLFNLVFFGVIILIVLTAYLIIGYLIAYEYQRVYFGTLFFIVLIIGYVLLNLMQIVKLNGEYIVDSFVILKRRVSKLLVLFAGEFIGLLLLYATYWTSFNLVRGSFDINPAFNTLTLMVLIFYNAFNRIVFFNLCKHK